MAQRSNDERVLNISAALEELNDEVVYVGGSDRLCIKLPPEAQAAILRSCCFFILL